MIKFPNDKKILAALILPFIFWIYLLFSTEMVIRYDAAHFEMLAKLIAAQGWAAYFKQGPTLEPLYPLIISLSMKKAAFLSVSYQKLQICFQIAVLILSQLLIYKVLVLLKVRSSLTAGVLLYFGLSPAIINSAFSQFSEILTYPLILGSLIAASRAWNSILKGGRKPVIQSGILFTVIAISAVFLKAMMEYIFLLFILPFAGLAFYHLIRNQKRQAQCAFIFIAIFLVLSQSALHGFKSLNKKYNGHYAFTDYRGPYMLYHYTIRRTEPFNKETFLVALTSIPGEKVCRAICGNACDRWWWDSYSIAQSKKDELLSSGVAEKDINSSLVRLAAIEALKNPVQYTMFMSFEAAKLLFWESTMIGFVKYPRWLEIIHHNILFKNLLRLFSFLLTSYSLGLLLKYVWKNFRFLLDAAKKENEQYAQVFLIFYFLLIYILLYSTVITITRYSLPIAPLYLIAIAIAGETLLNRKINSKKK